jgi:hypothetical protein
VSRSGIGLWRAWTAVSDHPVMSDDRARRRSLLLTALVAARLPDDVPEARMLRGWLDTWRGLGDVVTGMKRQGFDIRLSDSVFGWRAEFCRSQVNPMPRWLGRGAAASPWRAVQYAAVDTLIRIEQA